MILTNISTPLLGFVDTAVLGHLDSENFLAAVALGGLIFSFIFWGFGFLRMGTTGLTAHAYGENNREESNAILMRALLLALVIASVILFLSQSIASISFWVIQSTFVVEQFAEQYFQIRIWSTPATLCSYVLMGWFLGQQNVRVPLLVMLVTNISNILLDLLFVIQLDMHVDGVALATVIAEYIGLLVAIFATLRILLAKKSVWHWKNIITIAKFKAMFLINFNIFVRTWCLIFTFAFFTVQSAKMGVVILAANTVLLNFQTFMSYALDGFAHAAEALVGRAKGAKNKKLLTQTISTAALWSGMIAVLFSISYLFFGKYIVDLLTTLDNVKEVTDEYYGWVIAMPLISFVCYLFDGVFIGAMWTKAMRNTMLFSLIFFFLPTWYFTQNLGNHGLWMAMACFMLARSFSMYLVFMFSSRKIIE